MKTVWVMTAFALLGMTRIAHPAPGDRDARTVHGVRDGRADDTDAVRPALDRLGDFRVFAEPGGNSVTQDPTGRSDVPERPLQVLIGGADQRTMFILTHHALDAVQI